MTDTLLELPAPGLGVSVSPPVASPIEAPFTGGSPSPDPQRLTP